MYTVKIWIPLTLALLAGCSFPTAPEVRPPPGSVNRHGATSTLTFNRTSTFGVVYSPQTLKDLDYLNRYHDHALHSLEGRWLVSPIRQAYIESSPPNVAIDRVKQALDTVLPNVTFYSSTAALTKAKPDFIVVVYTHHVLVTPRSSDIEATFSAEFFSPNFGYLGCAEGHRAAHMPALWTHTQRTPEIVAQLDSQRALQASALSDFENSLTKMVGNQTTARE